MSSLLDDISHNIKMDKVFKELLRVADLYDAMVYELKTQFVRGIADDTWKLGGIIAFHDGSWADHNMDLMYWKRVNFEYLPKKSRGTPIVWYKFIGKHSRVKYTYNPKAELPRQ